jgi:hypothetical protein
MKILIYTTHRTGSTSLANFLMFNYGYDYKRHSYFKRKFNTDISDIIIKLTPYEEPYEDVKDLFDKRIILTRLDVKSQAESRVFADVFGRKFSSYSINDSFLNEYSTKINEMEELIKLENKNLSNYTNCLHITYEELYQTKIGIIKLEEYFDIKFKYNLEYKRYRNMNRTLI